MKLSKYFKLEEFRCKDGTPVPVDLVTFLRNFCEDNLDFMREFFGPIKITSGYRTKAHNIAVGGVKDSYHVYGNHPWKFAVDFVVPGEDLERVFWAMKNLVRTGLIEPGGLVCYKKQGFIHYDNRGKLTTWTPPARRKGN